MLTVAIISQKGGSGKTLVATALAAAHDQDAVVLDLDMQRSAMIWGDLREADHPVVVDADTPRLGRVLDTARDRGVSLVVVDTPPALSSVAVDAARAADLVLIPCRCSLADLHSVTASLDIARAAGVDHFVLLNAVPAAGKLADQAQEAIELQGAKVAPVRIHQRVSHVYAFASGLTAAEYDPRSKAAAELEALYTWGMGEANG